jgi:Subtilase family
LVVGGITYDGKLPERTRIEPMIQLYAPSGVDWRTRERSRVLSAEMQLDAVQAIQNCESGTSANSTEAVATLDWGQTKDIRSAMFLERTEAAWQAAGEYAIFGPVGCLAPDEIGNGILLDRISGNSVATALVSAVAAQMFALDPQLSAAEARDILLTTARTNRVSGLPVLDATGALQLVLERFVERSTRDWLPGSEVLPDTIASRSLAPGLMGQSAWRRLRDDPPLEISYKAITRRGDSCESYDITVMTNVQAIGQRRLRIANTPKIDRRSIPCSRRLL